MSSLAVLHRAEAILDGLGAPVSMRELLRYPLVKAEAQLARNSTWPVLNLPLTLSEAYGLDAALSLDLATSCLLLYGFADLTDDAQDGDLRGDWSWQRAVNAGNALAFLGTEILGALALPDATRRALVSAYARAGRAMTFGQEADLLARYPRIPSVEDYLRSVAGKSGASAAFFASCPAIAAERPDSEIEALRTYGESLGIALQILSDLAAYSGPESQDHRNQQVTLPVIFAFAQAPESGDRLCQALQDPRRSQELAALLRDVGADRYCQMRAEVFRRKALRALASVDLPEATQAVLAVGFPRPESSETLEI